MESRLRQVTSRLSDNDCFLPTTSEALVCHLLVLLTPVKKSDQEASRFQSGES